MFKRRFSADSRSRSLPPVWLTKSTAILKRDKESVVSEGSKMHLKTKVLISWISQSKVWRIMPVLKASLLEIWPREKSLWTNLHRGSWRREWHRWVRRSWRRPTIWVMDRLLTHYIRPWSWIRSLGDIQRHCCRMCLTPVNLDLSLSKATWSLSASTRTLRVPQYSKDSQPEKSSGVIHQLSLTSCQKSKSTRSSGCPKL